MSYRLKRVISTWLCVVMVLTSTITNFASDDLIVESVKETTIYQDVTENSYENFDVAIDDEEMAGEEFTEEEIAEEEDTASASDAEEVEEVEESEEEKENIEEPEEDSVDELASPSNVDNIEEEQQDTELELEETLSSPSDVIADDLDEVESTPSELEENDFVVENFKAAGPYVPQVYTLEDFMPNRITSMTKFTVQKGGSVPSGSPVRILSTISNAGLYKSGEEYTVYAHEDDTIKYGLGDKFRMQIKLKEVVGLGNLDTSETTSLAGMFSNTTWIEKIDFSGFDTSNVTDMSGMFWAVGRVSNLDLSSFDTSNVTNMSNMFFMCLGLKTVDLSSFDTRNVTDMSKMFASAMRLEKILINPDTFVTNGNCAGMFDACYVTGDINGRYTKAASADEAIITYITDLMTYNGSWTTTQLMNIPVKNKYVKKGTRAIPPTADELKNNRKLVLLGWYKEMDLINEWDFDNDIVTDDMKLYAKWGMDIKFELGNGAHFISTPSSTVYEIDRSFNITLPDESNLICKGEKFDVWYLNSSFTSRCSVDNKFEYDDLKGTGTVWAKWIAAQEVYDVSDFINSELDAKLSGGLSSITKITFVYSNTAPTGTLVYYPDTFGVTGVYQNGTEITVCVNKPDMINLCSGAFKGLTNLEEIENIDLLNTNGVTDLSEVFYGCSMLKKIDVSSFNTMAATTMRSMFEGCSSLTDVDVNSFDTRNVEDMSSMFKNCSSITELYLRFNTIKVTDMSNMFNGCTSATKIVVEDTFFAYGAASTSICDNTSVTITIKGSNTMKFDLVLKLQGTNEIIAKRTFSFSKEVNDTPLYNLAKDLYKSYIVSFNQKIRDVDISYFDDATIHYDGGEKVGFLVNNSIKSFDGCDLDKVNSVDVFMKDMKRVVFYNPDSTEDYRFYLTKAYRYFTIKQSMYNRVTATACNALVSSKGLLYQNGDDVILYAFKDDPEVALYYKKIADDVNICPQEYWGQQYKYWHKYMNEDIYKVGIGDRQIDDVYGGDIGFDFELKYLKGSEYYNNILDKKFTDIQREIALLYANKFADVTLADLQAHGFLNVRSYYIYERNPYTVEFNPVTANPWRSIIHRSTEGIAASGQTVRKEVFRKDYTVDFRVICIENINTYKLATIKTTNTEDEKFLSLGGIKPEPSAGGGGGETPVVYDNKFTTDDFLSDRGLVDSATKLTIQRGGVPTGTAEFILSTKSNAGLYRNNSTELIIYINDDDKLTIGEKYKLSGFEKVVTMEGLGNIDVDKNADLSSLFANNTSMTTIDLLGFDTRGAKSMAYMFAGCKSLSSVDVSDFDSADVSDMSNMFNGCEALVSIYVNGLNTANVKDMSNMFANCKNVQAIDIETFSTRNVQNMSNMFNGCAELRNIAVGAYFVLHNGINQSGIHDNCPLLNDSNYGKFTKKSYTIKFNYNDATGDATSSEIEAVYIAGQNVVRPANPSRSGYTFTNWYTEKELKNTYTFSVADKNMTLYAGWKVPNSNNSNAPKYFSSVTYSGGGGGGGGGGNGNGNRASSKLQNAEQPNAGFPGASVPKQSDAKQVNSKANEVAVFATDVAWRYDAVNNTWQLSLEKIGANAMASNGFVQIVSVDATTGLIKNDVYNFDAAGNMITGWAVDATGSMYYFNANAGNDIGKMAVGWQEIGTGSWYFFGTDGKLLTNTVTPDGKTVGADGLWNANNTALTV